MRNKKTILIVVGSMFASLVFVATFINVPFPGAAGGLVHLGTLVLMIVAMRFGKYSGAIAGGIGMTLFDVLGGWFIWAPGTFIVRLAMGYVVGLIAHNHGKQGQNILLNFLAWGAGLVIMIVGYYLYEAIFLTTFEAALASILGNVIQFIIALIAPIAVLYIPRIPFIDDNF